MLVVKRDGRLESVKFDKITARISNLSYGLSSHYISPTDIAQKVIAGIYDQVPTHELDKLAAEVTASMVTTHPDHATLSARIIISSLHKYTSRSFYSTMKRLYKYVNPKTGEQGPLIAKDVFALIQQHAALLDEAIDYTRDFTYDYFGLKTLERSYLLKIDGQVVERPQHMLMRVAVGIHKEDIQAAIQTYHLLSERWFTHATPTLFNAGTPRPQLSSCFLLAMEDDSIEGIYSTLKKCAQISQYAGGIGLSIHNIRATGSYIKGTNGISNGIVPMLRNFDMTARYVDQGGGRRKGSFAIYLEPWHADIFAFLDLKKNHGKEELRARDLFYALWISDLFMKRVQENGSWSLFCPHECPGLAEVYGEAFEALYLRYEREGRARKTIKAQELWFAILQAQIETGTPYMLFKDAANQKSNQKNVGTIRSSNLCTEIIEYTDKDEVAVCNLASMCLPNYITPEGEFDHERLFEVTRLVARNLNKIIDINHYPVPEAEKSNLRHRPIGIGVQGLADTFLKLRLPFDSPPARALNKAIFETLYFAALTASNELAKVEGPYASYEGSPAAQGLLQFDLWGVGPATDRWDWQALKRSIKRHGLRNSLLIAPMPTASTSQIMGNNEAFEPYTSNLYTRRVLSGEFIVFNKHLLKDLIDLGLWNEEMKGQIIAANGSIQGISTIPEEIKKLYRTVWEIPQRSIIDMAADRGAFICQSQSLNLHVQNPTFAKLSSMHFHAWKKGLKTGMYYLRTKAAVDAIKFTLQRSAPLTAQAAEPQQCSLDDAECLLCSS